MKSSILGSFRSRRAPGTPRTLGALGAALLLFACSADLRGTVTPPLEGAGWVWPGSEPQPTSGDLTLIEFFAPT